MKKLVIALMLLMSVFAQAQVSINVNIGTPPNWGPQGNDDSRYYYLPDIDVYYDVNQSVFIYDNNGKWERNKRLPERCRQYDLYDGYKVVIKDYKGNTPYNYHKKHRANYPKGYKGQPQKNRGERPVKNERQNNKQKSQKEGSKKAKEHSDRDQKHSQKGHH